MKILLLTDIPPCKNFPAGLVLDQLCRFLPRGSIACFAITYSVLNARISPDLEWIPIKYEGRSREALALPQRLNRLNRIAHLCLYYYNVLTIRHVADQVVRYGQAFGVDTLWCTLEGQSLIRLAFPAATKLGVPLLTQVFDPPTWELRAHSAHKISQTKVLVEFAEAVRSSRACATASWPMAHQYAKDYGTKTLAFLPSIDSRIALPPAAEIHTGHDLIIGMAGQLYATEEWKALVTALDAVDWRISGRDVQIRFLGKKSPLSANKSGRIEYLGWHTQENCVKLLSEADILYLPYWLNPAFDIEARFSFPSKLTTYLAAGRPVLFHGPEYAAAAIFLKDTEAGLACYSNKHSEIIEILTTLATDMSLYSRLTQNGRKAFDKYLTLSSLRKSFATFLQIEEDALVPTEQSIESASFGGID